MHFSMQVRKPLFDIKLNEALTHLGNKPSKEFFRRKGCNGNAHPLSKSTLCVSVDASPPFRNKTSKTGLQRPAARYDSIGKIGGG